MRKLTMGPPPSTTLVDNSVSKRVVFTRSSEEKNVLVRVFWGTSMGKRHQGLSEVAKKEADIDVHELDQGEMLLFVNRAMDKMQVMASLGRGPHNIVLAYWKGKPGQRIDELAIQYIAQAFNGTTIDYNKALKKALEQRFSQKVN